MKYVNLVSACSLKLNAVNYIMYVDEKFTNSLHPMWKQISHTCVAPVLLEKQEYNLSKTAVANLTFKRLHI